MLLDDSPTNSPLYLLCVNCVKCEMFSTSWFASPGVKCSVLRGSYPRCENRDRQGKGENKTTRRADCEATGQSIRQKNNNLQRLDWPCTEPWLWASPEASHRCCLSSWWRYYSQGAAMPSLPGAENIRHRAGIVARQPRERRRLDRLQRCEEINKAPPKTRRL